jgi:hypothetical protein
MIGTIASVDKRRESARIARERDRALASAIVASTQATAKPSATARITTAAIRFVGNHR